MKKILSIMLSTALLLGAASAAYGADTKAETAVNTEKAAAVATGANASYNDLKTTNWAYEAVNAMNGKGIVKGYPDGSFKPSNTVNYGEFIKMALIASTGEDIGNAPAVNKETGAKQNWAMNYYNKALELKYFGSTDIKAEQLNRQIPRGDMACIISNILGETKIEDYDKLEASLKDINSTVKHDYDIIKTYSAGIITGYEEGTFKPENTLTRAESAVVIYRLTDESKRVLPTDKKEEVKEPATEEATEKPKTGTDIGSVIENYRTFEQVKIDAGYSSPLAEATSYEYITDMSSYKVTLGENRGTKWVDINGQSPLKLGWGNLYFMKDNKIVQMTQDGSYDDSRDEVHTDITTIEYFVFPNYKSEEVPYVQGIGRISHMIGIMPNPLYVKK